MKKCIIGFMAALALGLCVSDAEARGCRGGRGGLFHGGLRARLQERRANRGWHLLPRNRVAGGCSTCEAEPVQVGEPVDVTPPREEVRVADKDQE